MTSPDPVGSEKPLSADERRLLDVDRIARILIKSDFGNWDREDESGREEYRVNARALLDAGLSFVHQRAGEGEATERDRYAAEELQEALADLDAAAVPKRSHDGIGKWWSLASRVRILILERDRALSAQRADVRGVV